MDEWWWLEDHNGAQAQIEDTRETAYKFLEQQLKITNGRETREFQMLRPLRKTEKWKLASDFCTFFALWR